VKKDFNKMKEGLTKEARSKAARLAGTIAGKTVGAIIEYSVKVKDK
jgi:hypothetical protein